MPTLNDVTDIIQRGIQVRAEHRLNNGDILLLSAANLSKGRRQLVIPENQCFINESASFGYERFLIQRGDIIIQIAGSLDNLGNFFRYNLPTPAIAGDTLAILRPSVNNLEELLERNYFRFKELGLGGALNRITLVDLGNFMLV